MYYIYNLRVLGHKFQQKEPLERQRQIAHDNVKKIHGQPSSNILNPRLQSLFPFLVLLKSHFFSLYM